MHTSPNVVAVLIELWLSLVKLLGRPGVYLQLLVALAILVAIGLLAHLLDSAVQRRRMDSARRLRAKIVAEREERLHDPQQDAGDPAVGGMSLLDQATLDALVVSRLGVWSRLVQFAAQLFFPVCAVLALYVVYVYFVAQGWYGGLLAQLTTIYAGYLGGRLLVGLAAVIGSPDRVGHYDRLLVNPFFFLVGFLFLLNAFVDLGDLSRAVIAPTENGELTLGTAFVGVVGFYLWVIAINLVKELSIASVSRRPNVNIGSLDATLTLLQYALFGLGLVVVLQTLQVNTTAIAAITGGLSIGVGIALQDVLKNFLGGIIVLFEGAVRPGDLVELNGVDVEVDRLSIRSTIVRTFDNVEYIVPNQHWLNSTVKTYTRNSRRSRARIPVGVSYSADPYIVQQLLLEIAKAHPDVLQEPPPVVVFVDFGEVRLDFLVLFWVDDIGIKSRVTGELRYRIWDALKEQKIELAFPQRELHIRSSVAAPTVSALPALLNPPDRGMMK